MGHYECYKCGGYGCCGECETEKTTPPPPEEEAEVGSELLQTIVTPPHYSQRNLMSLRHHYTDHVCAMTAEGLHNKSDIAAELAHRDQEICKLLTRVAQLEACIRRHINKLDIEIEETKENIEKVKDGMLLEGDSGEN